MEATGRASVFPLPMTSMVMEMAAWGGGGVMGELQGEEEGYGELHGEEWLWVELHGEEE